MSKLTQVSVYPQEIERQIVATCFRVFAKRFGLLEAVLV